MSAIVGRRARAQWHELTKGGKQRAVTDLVAIYPPYSTAAACGVSIEAVRVIVAEWDGE